jgi:HK97 family phage portal protein
MGNYGTRTGSGQIVSAETAKRVASVYRCANTISNDIATMPFQVYHRVSTSIDRIYPDAVAMNIAFLLERQPNRWMNPFVWKRTIINWLLFWGNAYIWQPVSEYPELFILPSSTTYPVLDENGDLWYTSILPNTEKISIPDVEMVHLMINSSDGFNGKSVLTYARETIGRQLSAHETQDKISGGLMPTALLWVDGEIDKSAREIVRKAYLDAVTGSQNAGGVAVLDNKIKKFETVTMTPEDAQFLEGINATDADIANFFDLPLHKLNMGKQSYESNDQQEMNYLKSTLNPYLVQWEQAGNVKWIAERDQPFVYLKFNRDSLLQTDATTRANYIAKMIESGQLSPNEGRAINDMSSHAGGDSHYLFGHVAKILPDGSMQLPAGSTGAAPAPAPKNNIPIPRKPVRNDTNESEEE